MADERLRRLVREHSDGSIPSRELLAEIARQGPWCPDHPGGDRVMWRAGPVIMDRRDRPPEESGVFWQVDIRCSVCLARPILILSCKRAEVPWAYRLPAAMGGFATPLAPCT